MTSHHESRKGEIAFIEEVALAIGVPLLGLTYEHAGPKGYLTDAEFRTAQRKVGEAVVQAILNQQFGGILALRAHQTYRPQSLQHGSFRSPEELSRGLTKRPSPVLKPQQAFWRDTTGKLYKDGEPAVCASETYHFPLLRSQLNRDRVPGFEGVVISTRKDITNTSYDFVGQEFLSMIQGAGTSSWVYMFRRRDEPEYRDKYRNPITHEEKEYRIFDEIHPDVWVETSPSDLPPELIVIDGETHDAFEFLDTLNQRTLMDQIEQYEGILTVEPLGGLFPLSLHPNLQ